MSVHELSEAEKIRVLWEERTQLQGAVKFLRTGLSLAVLALSLLTGLLALRGG